MKTHLMRLLLAAFFLFTVQSAAQTDPVLNACEVRAALQKLDVTGTVLYVAAHPDDENTALLAYFAGEKKYRTVYLSLTRGEGGQNILGSEKGEDLGVIRTEELLAARRVDGAEQLFTRAIDFGFSKTSDETIAMWENDSVIADIVWAIRCVRPDVIITRFSPTEGGHGNHTASAILADEAYKRSGDPSWYPAQLRYVRPWKAQRLFFNRLKWYGNPTFAADSTDRVIDTGMFNPWTGLSYTEIAGISRSLHKTQAMGSERRRGGNTEYFRLIDEASKPAGDSHDNDLFADIVTSWKRYPDGAAVDELLQQAVRDYDPVHPEKILGILLQAYDRIKALGKDEQHVNDALLSHKEQEIVTVIKAVLGIRCEILSTTATVLPGQSVHMDAEIIQRSGRPVELRSITSSMLGIDKQVGESLQSNVVTRVALVGSVPASMHPTQPYWLQKPADHFMYRVPSQLCLGLPETPDSLTVTATMMIDGKPVTMTIPVRFRKIDPVAGEVYRPVVILPKLDVSISQKTLLWKNQDKNEVSVRVMSNDSSAQGRLLLKVPSGYIVDPASVPFTMSKLNEDHAYQFEVTVSSTAGTGNITAVAEEKGSTWSQHGADISYPHIVPQFVMHDAQLTAIRADLRITKRRIGCIMGPGDEVPSALRLCGYDVIMVDDDSLQSGMLSAYDAIVIGARAYNIRPQLRRFNARLMEYVHDGGTIVVQYQTPGKDVESIGPYPFKISRDRVTDERAEMVVSTQGKSLSSRLMSEPNKLTSDDFNNWVQERGLYFADHWDANYETPFACHDPNEAPTQGSVILATYGKGVYCYTGLAFFRQLPAGVPGAFRIFANLIELSTANR
jgi:LmbE family N-acetylglucosaminyl deacetylase